MLSGYFGGAVDRLMVLLMDTLYQLSVLLLSVVLAFLGKVIPNTTDALCVVCVPQYFRVVRHKSTRRRASCLYVSSRVWRWGGAGSLFVGEVFGVHTRGFIEFVEVAFSISSASPPWAYGRCSDGLCEGLQLKHPVCSLDAATAMSGHHHRAMPATQQFIDLRFAAAVQR